MTKKGSLKSSKGQPLRPVHFSLRPEYYYKRTPYNMERIQIPHELNDSLTRIAIEIFNDCSNVNHSFQDALLAIYISGLQHGQALAKGN